MVDKLPMSKVQRAWVLGVLYSRGIAGHEAKTALMVARFRTPSRSFGGWLDEIRANPVDSLEATYGSDALRVVAAIRAAQIQVEPYRTG